MTINRSGRPSVSNNKKLSSFTKMSQTDNDKRLKKKKIESYLKIVPMKVKTDKWIHDGPAIMAESTIFS